MVYKAAQFVLALAVCVLTAAHSHAIPFDDFQGDQEVEALGSGTVNISSVANAGSLGGTRDLVAGVISIGNPNSGAGALVSSDLFGHQTYPGSTGITQITWDGDRNPLAIDYTGLGGVDITQDGSTSIRIIIDSFDYPQQRSVTFRVKIYDAGDPSGQTYSEADFVLDRAYMGALIEIPYSTFAQSAGPGGSASLQNVGAVIFTIDGSNAAGADLTFRFDSGLPGCDRTVDQDNDGVNDCDDLCPDDPDKTDPGVCGCFVPDTNIDGDPYLDCEEICDDDPNKRVPGICGCGEEDLDDDSDGFFNCQEICDDDPNKQDPGVCGCGEPDVDSDGDGTFNCEDDCPDDPLKTERGICDCGQSEDDSDDDGAPDCIDECPDNGSKITPGVCGCPFADVDTDRDGVLDCDEECIDDPDKQGPGQCGCGAPDTDSDNDGSADCNEICDENPDKTEPGICGCEEADTDSDGDGLPDCNDQCPGEPDVTPEGACGCPAAQRDDDGDGTPNCLDQCPEQPEKVEPGVCGCPAPDVDGDNDGSLDCKDGCPDNPDKTTPGICGCALPDNDLDADGRLDCVDHCPHNPTSDDICVACVEIEIPQSPIDVSGVALRKAGRAVLREARRTRALPGRKLVQLEDQVAGFYTELWHLAWVDLPPLVLNCGSEAICVSADISSIKDKLLRNARGIKRIARRTARAIKRSGEAARAKRAKKRVLKTYKAFAEEANKLPTDSSLCVSFLTRSGS